MKDQGGGKISGEEGEPKGGNPCGEHGPEVYLLRAHSIRDAGENYERDRVADLEPGDNGTGLGRRHRPFPPEHREGPRIGHEYQAVEDPRCADPGEPPVESSPFPRIRNHSLSKESRNAKPERNPVFASLLYFCQSSGMEEIHKFIRLLPIGTYTIC